VLGDQDSSEAAHGAVVQLLRGVRFTSERVGRLAWGEFAPEPEFNARPLVVGQLAQGGPDRRL
jgi:hypothetical protein